MIDTESLGNNIFVKTNTHTNVKLICQTKTICHLNETWLNRVQNFNFITRMLICDETSRNQLAFIWFTFQPTNIS